MVLSSSTVVDPSTSSTMVNDPPLVNMEAKIIVATGHANCQKLNDMLSREDSSSMVVVIASSSQTSTPSPPSPPPVMDPKLLAVACSGSWQKLQSFLNGPPPSPPPVMDPTSTDGTIGSSTIQQPSCDEEALIRVSLLDGVTFEGDSFLHVMATNSVGEALIEDGLGHIRRKAVQFLFRQNNNGDTPLHCAARAAKSEVMSFLLDLARGDDASTVKVLLETENNSRWTVLHEAVRVGNNDIVNFLMTEHPGLASFPEDGTSPLYLAILLEKKIIAKTLHEKSRGVLSYAGPNGQNALHAAVFRGIDLTKMLLGWNNGLTIQQDDNGSTPLHLAASVLEQRDRRTIRLFLLKANSNALYQPDHKGSFPIHVAASVDASYAVSDYIRNSPNCAGLRDARGRTFLHVAADKRQRWTVYHSCRNRSLSWILNMQDNNGNTALHLAVQTESLLMSCVLFGNRQVHLSLTNEKGETPLDIARSKLPEGGLYYIQNSEAKIHRALKNVGAKCGICRHDYFEKNDIVQARQDEIHKIKILKDSTQNLCIGSVLIATVTFGATFAMPGGYRADDHTNGGTPTLAGRYAFDAFIIANALAFAFSVMAVISLMSSGSPLYNLRFRVINLGMAFAFMEISVTCLVAAFATGTYMMLGHVAHKAAVTVCALSSLVLIYTNLDLAIKNAMVMPTTWWRQGKFHSIVLIFPLSALSFIGSILFQLWPIIVILGLTAKSQTIHKVEPAAQPPTPLA